MPRTSTTTGAANNPIYVPLPEEQETQFDHGDTTGSRQELLSPPNPYDSSTTEQQPAQAGAAGAYLQGLASRAGSTTAALKNMAQAAYNACTYANLKTAGVGFLLVTGGAAGGAGITHAASRANSKGNPDPTSTAVSSGCDTGPLTSRADNRLCANIPDYPHDPASSVHRNAIAYWAENRFSTLFQLTWDDIVANLPKPKSFSRHDKPSPSPQTLNAFMDMAQAISDACRENSTLPESELQTYKNDLLLSVTNDIFKPRKNKPQNATQEQSNFVLGALQPLSKEIEALAEGPAIPSGVEGLDATTRGAIHYRVGQEVNRLPVEAKTELDGNTYKKIRDDLSLPLTDSVLKAASSGKAPSPSMLADEFLKKAIELSSDPLSQKLKKSLHDTGWTVADIILRELERGTYLPTA